MASPLIYALHSGNLYGTERMALATLDALRPGFEPVLFAPPGDVVDRAIQMGITVHSYSCFLEFAWKLRKYFADHKNLAVAATGVKHSIACLKWNQLYGRRLIHIHVVHGGADEGTSYGRKKRLNGTGAIFVAVSSYVRERLIANGVESKQIVVIENFLADDRIQKTPTRPEFHQGGVKRVIMISRLDPIKRVDVMLDALDQSELLRALTIHVFGSGWDIETLRRRAAERHPNVTFEGFQNNIASELAASDLLVHTCPVEPFGLAIIEAMAARVPVLVPHQGGAASLVEDNVTGFHFEANQPESLASRLLELMDAPADLLNRVVSVARTSIASRFSERARARDYRALLSGESL